ncbi:hypothetical protein [Desulfohalobium retbaense]|uniref:Uncharacterized protein n=1 Tax=Desulfohalobium retbaense (strain ATCC 49708 / DSM 5692 / JCM 16813 / HR100) TaxID=485915 RepID=C8X5C8_DESRD|nr:hypothetical protein [Desulfohalobium retbaense]ACV69625.1 hypothetical protein Dret_2342 [Desulfohalobium retbaense DSM 5692]
MVWLELLRRLTSLILLCVGAFFLVWPGFPVIVVKPADTVHQRTSSSINPAGRTPARHPAASLPVPAWSQLVARIQAEDPDLASRRWETQPPRYVFPATTPALSGFRARTLHSATDPATGAQFNLLRAYPQDIYGLPDQFLYPYRWTGLGLMAAGLGLYILVPRRKWPLETLRHARGASVIAPDLLGLLMTPFFLALPVAVVADTAPEAVFAPTQGGWFWLYIIFGLLVGCGIMLLCTGLRFSLLGYRILPEELRIHTWRGSKRIPWSSMLSWGHYEKTTSRTLGRLLLFGGGSFSALGLGLALTKTPEHGVHIDYLDTDGAPERLNIMANHLPGFERIPRALRDHQIPVTPSPRRPA